MSSSELSPSPRSRLSESRAGQALRARHNWEQLLKFSIVGASGFVVNLAVFTVLWKHLNYHYLVAATGSFLVAATSNYLLNRIWTFRHRRGHVAVQGARFLVVATAAWLANLVVLRLLVALTVPTRLAQAIAIILVTPVNFLGNKLWSFRR
jgi:dolichol-phosphate mannosyltransferase